MIERSTNDSINRTGIFMVIAFGLIACMLYGVGAAIRGNVGILVTPMAEQCGVDYGDVSFCVAVMNIVFGIVQPVFGALAAKTSNRFVLITGAGLLICSMIGMMQARSFAMLLFSLGIIFGFGAGALAFGLILTSAIYFVGQEHAMTISGMLNAAAGMISFILAPVMQGLLNLGGLSMTLTVLGVIAALLVPVAFVVTSKDPSKGFKGARLSEDSGASGGFLALKNAFRNRTYLLLIAGFSTCGFHMVIIESHLFNQYVFYGIDRAAASWAFSFYGIATIAGALLSGWLSVKLHKGRLLGFYYGFRAVWVMIYLFLMPKNSTTAIVFSIGLGMTGDATVSPTSGLVNQNFDLRSVATLIGFLFFGHQVGAFLSAWLGGLLFDQMGSYVTIWMIDVALCAFASIMSLRIKR